MEQIAIGFASTLGKHISAEAVVFIISMIPILELRGGLLVAPLLGLPITTAVPLCILGNIVPIPFILLFVKHVFKWCKRKHICEKLILKMENRAMKKSDSIKKYEFWGLAFFVGIPLPGTGAWTGSMVASLLEIDWKKAVLAELVGIIMATVIMSVLGYGVLGAVM